MKLKVFTFSIATIALISCQAKGLAPSLTPTEILSTSTSLFPTTTPSPQKTATPMRTITTTPTMINIEIVPTSTMVFPAYSTKQVLIQYGNEGGFGEFNDILGRTSHERLVLYSDGQLILSKDNQFFEKALSPNEIEQLLFQINNTGFYNFETNQNHDQTDKLYDFGDQYQPVYDGQIYYLSIHGNQPRTICYYGPYKDFLVSEAKDLFQYFEDYAYTGLIPYKPDRIILAIYKGTESLSTTEESTSIMWPSDLPLLETSHMKFMYLEGKAATDVSSFFNDSPSVNFFDEAGNHYTVSVHVVLPHENLLQPQEWVCSK